jgi:hypothetical protein
MPDRITIAAPAARLSVGEVAVLQARVAGGASALPNADVV